MQTAIYRIPLNFLLITIALLALTACGDKDSNNGSEAPTIEAPETATFEAQGPEGISATHSSVVGFIDSVTAKDDVDGELPEVSHDMPETLPIGDTEVTFSVKDSHNNTGTGKTRVSVVDTTPPKLMLIGEPIVEIPIGQSYEDEGATAEDVVDGDRTHAITKTSNVKTDTVGSYAIMYNVSDASGNAAKEASRTVNVYQPKAQMRFINAAVDAPELNLQFNDTDWHNNGDYGEASPVGEVNAGTHKMDIDAITPAHPSNLQQGLLSQDEVECLEGKHYDVMAIGKIADETLEHIVLEIDKDFDTTKARLRFIHVAPVLKESRLRVHLVPPGQELTSGTVVETLDYKAHSSEPHLLEPGEWEVHVTPENNLTPLYSSGPLMLGTGSDRLMSLSENPVHVSTENERRSNIVITDMEHHQSTVRFHKLEGFYINAFHMAKYANELDVLASSGGQEFTLGNDIPTHGNSDYGDAPAGIYDARVINSEDTPEVVVIKPGLEFNNGQVISAIIHGTTNDMDAVLVEEDPRKIALHNRVRFTNVATKSGNDGYDIYIMPSGSTDISDETPIISGLAYGESSPLVNLRPAALNLFITAAGTKDIVYQETNDGDEGPAPAGIVAHFFVADHRFEEDELDLVSQSLNPPTPL